MKALKRNRQTIYYAVYQGNTPLTDSDGYRTGEYSKTYATAVAAKMNVSAARGSTDTELFGQNTNYSKTMVTDDMSCPITEESRLWIGITPTRTVGEITENVPHNYIVSMIAKSLNSITYAISEVDAG